MQNWLWAAPAKHSTRQITGVLERIGVLTRLGVSAHLTTVSDAVLGRFARRLASRAPAVAARIAEPARTIEVACFLRYTLLRTTDRLLLMVRRQVADMWGAAAEGIDANLSELAQRYQQLLGELGVDFNNLCPIFQQFMSKGCPCQQFACMASTSIQRLRQ